MTKEKQFKIFEFPETYYDPDEGWIESISVKVSRKANNLSNKSRKLWEDHQRAVNALMSELEKDNPDIDFSGFNSDQFSYFTGENMT